jgi:outer membrane protein insertion porin family
MIIIFFLIILLSPLHGDIFSAEKISFSADIPFSKHEFFYLTDLKQNKIASQEEIAHAYKQLQRKKRFNKIYVDIKSTKKAKTIHFSLISHWIFTQITISGIWFDRDRYENLYLQHPGDIFDMSIHEESVEAMKNLLYERGYFNCEVKDEIFYNKKDKTITVKITINKKRFFLIDKVIVNPSSHAKDLSSLLVGKRYCKPILAKAKSRIKKYKTSLKRCIKKDKRRVTLLFSIKIEPRKSFAFHGNKFFTEKQIREEIIGQEKPNWLLDQNIVAEQILHAYYEKGFWKTKIRYKKIGPHKYDFYIEEGKRIAIKNVITRNLKTKKEEINKFFFRKLLYYKYYSDALLTRCKEDIKNFYFKHGFWDFSIIDQQFIKKKNEYDILLVVNKGKQRFSSKTGLPLDPESIAQERLQILHSLQKEGYWYVDAQPILKKKSTKRDREIIELSWNISKGERVLFGKLFLGGNTKLPFKRIMQEVCFKEGELWDRKKLDYTRKKLKELGIFKYIEIHPKKISHNQSRKPIALSLIDDDPIEIKLRVGYFLTSKNFLLKRESTPKFGSSLIFKNPLNIADKLSIEADFTRFEKNFVLSYQIPMCFKHAIKTKFKTYYHKYVHPLEVGKSDSAYEAEQDGFLVGITKEYKPRSFWGLNVGNEWMRTKKTRGNIKLSEKMINTTIPYFFAEPNLLVDNLDDEINTKNGSLTFFSIKTMIPLTNRSTTHKMMLDRSMFHHFGHDVVGALRIRIGHIFREKFEEIMPIERFFLGGPFSVRGYSKDTVPPLGATTIKNKDGTTRKEYAVQGGSSMLNGNLEMRLPIYKEFGGVIFQDLGLLSQAGFCLFNGKWSPTSGFGLRYQTPIGAIRFDIGWKWRKSFPSDTSYAWYLTIGQVF